MAHEGECQNWYAFLKLLYVLGTNRAQGQKCSFGVNVKMARPERIRTSGISLRRANQINGVELR